jgi:hypothetical protein
MAISQCGVWQEGLAQDAAAHRGQECFTRRMCGVADARDGGSQCRGRASYCYRRPLAVGLAILCPQPNLPLGITGTTAMRQPTTRLPSGLPALPALPLRARAHGRL